MICNKEISKSNKNLSQCKNYLTLYSVTKALNTTILLTCKIWTPNFTVYSYQSMLHNNPAERRPQLHCGGSLKSFISCSFQQTIKWHVNRNSEISDTYWILRGKATTCKTNKEKGRKHEDGWRFESSVMSQGISQCFEGKRRLNLHQSTAWPLNYPPECYESLTHQHSTTFQTTQVLTKTAVRTSLSLTPWSKVTTTVNFFNVLLTVHLSIILANDQLNAQPVHGTATYRCDDTRCCIIQFWPPDDEHNSAQNM